MEINGKTLRKISTADCEIIGRGAIGTVYRLDDETIVKVYEESVSPETIECERISARAAFVSGLPCAITFDTVDADGKIGVVYELFNAKTLASVVMNDMRNVNKYAADLAEIAKRMHTTKAAVVGSVKELWLDWCGSVSGKVPEAEIAEMKAVISTVPDSDTFVHGDLHPKNVMVQSGEYLLIDMGDVGYGNPAFDLAVIDTCLNVSAKFMPPEVVMSAYGMTSEICAQFYNAFRSAYGGDSALWDNVGKLSKVRHRLWNAINR
ncbi:MAG: phosphotransferase [Ruminococcus sp.]|jgi:uncharacterized protein (TIGR02172 family)|nr:phosphotransferase [Ruminococcus sp.]